MHTIRHIHAHNQAHTCTKSGTYMRTIRHIHAYNQAHTCVQSGTYMRTIRHRRCRHKSRPGISYIWPVTDVMIWKILSSKIFGIHCRFLQKNKVWVMWLFFGLNYERSVRNVPTYLHSYICTQRTGVIHSSLKDDSHLNWQTPFSATVSFSKSESIL
jgi:hypothetical protein